MTGRLRTAACLAALTLASLAPAAASGKTFHDAFQLVQLTPNRVYAETSFIPFALPDPPERVYRYKLGARTFVGTWTPATAGIETASATLGEIDKNRYTREFAATRGIVVDRKLSARERRHFSPLAELYRDADVLVLASGHPACGGLTRTQAHSIATGKIRSWSQVVSGASTDTIKVRYPTDVPHMGAKWVGKYNKQHLNYAPGSVGVADGGVSAAARGDQAIAAITTWAHVRGRASGICVVPLNGVAPSDETVSGLAYPEAFPVSYVVLRSVPGLDADGRAKITVMRRAMQAFLRSERLKKMLRAKGLLVTGDPLPPS